MREIHILAELGWTVFISALIKPRLIIVSCCIYSLQTYFMQLYRYVEFTLDVK